jgi:hypothetical protein
MDAEALNGYFENTIFSKAKASVLAGKWSHLEEPADLSAKSGVTDSVTEQAHLVDATWSEANKTLTIARATAGKGYWIPYLGNGIPGVGTDKRGLGTYSPAVGSGSTISWVATGPFSGCYAVALSGTAGMVFAHVITAASGYTCEKPEQQLADIAQTVGAQNPGLGQKASGNGLGFVFWTRIKGVWYRREVFIMPTGMVNSVGKKSRV